MSNKTSASALPPGLPAVTTLPGSGPRDGAISRPWWWFDDDFLTSLTLPEVRGVTQPSLLTEQDDETLSSVLASVRAARRKLRSGVTADVRAGLTILASVVAYVSGLFDAKTSQGVPSNLISLSLAQDAGIDLDQQLDALEEFLVSITSPTRGPVTAALTLGRGLGLIYLGHKLMQYADSLPD